MIFYPISPIRHFYRYGMIFVLVGLPLCLAASSNDWIIYEDRPAVVITCILLSLAGAVLIHVGFWEKFFAVLILSENEVRWKCPLRKTRVIQISQCVEIGAYIENANNGIPTERMYFSTTPNPQIRMSKSGAMRESQNLIKFWYSRELCDYIIQTYPQEKTNLLSEYLVQRQKAHY